MGAPPRADGLDPLQSSTRGTLSYRQPMCLNGGLGADPIRGGAAPHPRGTGWLRLRDTTVPPPLCTCPLTTRAPGQAPQAKDSGTQRSTTTIEHKGAHKSSPNALLATGFTIRLTTYIMIYDLDHYIRSACNTDGWPCQGSDHLKITPGCFDTGGADRAPGLG